MAKADKKVTVIRDGGRTTTEIVTDERAREIERTFDTDPSIQRITVENA